MRNLLIIATAFCALPLLGQTTILDETWSDGERSTQNLPNSAAWYSSGASSTLTLTAGSMTQLVGGTTAMDIAYLTGAYNSTIDLGIGESLRLSYDISFANRTTGSGYVRVGLYNTLVDPRITADGGGTANAAYLGATGYILNTGGLNLGSSVDFRRRTSPTSNNLMSSTSAYATLAGSTTFAGTVANDTIYAGLLEITRTDASTTSVFASLTAPDDSVVYSLTASDSSSHYSQFNTVGFISSSVNGDSFTLHSVNVSVVPIPEPGTLRPPASGRDDGRCLPASARLAGHSVPFHCHNAGHRISCNLFALT